MAKNDTPKVRTLEHVAQPRSERRKTDEQMAREEEREATMLATFSEFGPVTLVVQTDDGTEEITYSEATILPYGTLQSVTNGRPLAQTSYIPTVTRWALEHGHEVSISAKSGGLLIVKR